MQLPETIAAQNGSADIGTAEPAFRALISTFGLLKRVMEPYFARFGVSGTQWGVLRTLHRLEGDGEPEPRLTDLGHHLLVRPPSMTGAVDRLQRLGLVRRSASSTDQRAKHVRLTPAGRALVERVLEHHHAQIESVLGGLKPGEQLQLQSLLSRLETHLQPMAERSETHAATAARVTHITDGGGGGHDDINDGNGDEAPDAGGDGNVGTRGGNGILL